MANCEVWMQATNVDELYAGVNDEVKSTHVMGYIIRSSRDKVHSIQMSCSRVS